MIVTYEINRGTRFRLIAIGTQQSEKITLPYFEFQQEAMRRAPKEWPKLVRILDYFVESGAPKSAEKSKQLREGIFEFRTKGGLRLLWFYDEGRVVICVNGYIKQGQKIPPNEINEAIEWKNRYFQAKETGRLRDLKPK